MSKDLKEVAAVVGGSITGTEILHAFRMYAPDIIQGTQIVIGFLTVVYLIVKITTHKKHERSN